MENKDDEDELFDRLTVKILIIVIVSNIDILIDYKS